MLYRDKTTMNVNGLKCTFHMPKAVRRITNPDGSEGIAGLPPHAPRPAYAVDEYPASPTNWMHGSGKSSSYFVPVDAEHGMWLDFNANRSHTHDVAVAISVQGINPITGMKSDPIRLEQYKEMCPKHQREFKQDRFCEECQFKFPPQNYVAGNASPYGSFWIDGFRAEDGAVRQWYFTEEKMKGIAAQIIGDDRVYAIGIAFYLSKKPKPKPVTRGLRRGLGSLGGGQMYYSAKGFNSAPTGFSGTWNSTAGGGGTFSCNASPGDHIYHVGASMDSLESVGGYEPLGDIYDGQRLGSFEAESIDFAAESAAIEEEQTLLEIGAGAKIHQTIHQDPNNLDYWQDEPAGFIYINYCDQTTADRILKAGKRQEKTDGFMSGLNIKDD